jgi:hypothetical protein
MSLDDIDVEKAVRLNPVKKAQELGLIQTLIERIRELPYIDLLKKMALDGRSFMDIARYVQGERKDLVDVDPDSLRIKLSGYLRKNLDYSDVLKKNGGFKGGLIPDEIKRRVNAMSQKIDELEELEGLYRMQLERIKIDYDTEKNIKKLFATTHKEFLTAADILHKSFAIKESLGIAHAGRSKLNGDTDDDARLIDAEKRFGSNVNKVLRSPESRRKLLSALEIVAKAQISNEDVDNVIVIDSASV